MAKYFISLFALLLITSCDEGSGSYNSKSEPQTLLSKKEQLAHDFENNKLTEPLDFFDGVVAEFTLTQMHLVGVMKLNDKKAEINAEIVKVGETDELKDALSLVEKEIIEEAKRGKKESKRIYTKLKKIKPIGIGGSSFLNKCIKYGEMTEIVCNDLIENNGEFNFENGNVQKLIDVENDYVEFQSTYASYNNFKVGGEIDTDEMYEDSKKTREDKTKKKN